MARKVSSDRVALDEARLALTKHRKAMETHRLKETELKNQVVALRAKVQSGGKK